MINYNRPTRCTNFSKFYFGMKVYMFQTVPLSIIRSFPLYTQKWYMSYRFSYSVPSWSCSQAVCKPVWHIPLLCVQWKTPDDGQRNCPKHVEFHSKIKFWEIGASSWSVIRKVNFCVRLFPKYIYIYIYIYIIQIVTSCGTDVGKGLYFLLLGHNSAK